MFILKGRSDLFNKEFRNVKQKISYLLQIAKWKSLEKQSLILTKYTR